MNINNSLNVSESFTFFRSDFLPFDFQHISRSVIFVLFQQFMFKNVQFIQTSPAWTSAVCAYFTF